MKTKLFLLAFLTLAAGSGLFAQSILVDNFESGTLHPRFRPNNKDGGVAEVVDNPLKSGLNTSDKVLKITNNFSSQQINIDITKNAVDPAIDVVDKGVDRFRFKYLIEEDGGNVVKWKHNGNGTQVEVLVQPQRGNVWEYVEIEMSEMEMNTLDMIHLRLNDRVGGKSSDVIYIDDLEFYNSLVSGLKDVSYDMNAKCFPNPVNGQANVSFTLDRQAELSVDLVSLNGAVIENVYNGSAASGSYQLPFRVKSSGVYFVRIMLDGKEAEYLKIISK